MIVVVVTGNHYWLDGVVGVAVAALAVLFERRVRAARSLACGGRRSQQLLV